MAAQGSPVSATLNFQALAHHLAPRPAASHKGDFGHVLVIGGDEGFGGAALMAAEAAARCGAGLVSVATHPSHATQFLIRRPELMTRGVEAAQQLQPLFQRASVLILGPGLGQSAWGRNLFQDIMQALPELDLPLVLDADGLNLLATGEYDTPTPYDKWILTPHPGEAARLLACTTGAVQEDRPGAAVQLQERFGGVTVLKGDGTLVCGGSDARRSVERCAHGNPGMASGGMGDVLSGVLGGLLAQGFPPLLAARLGVCLHGLSGDRAAEQGQRGLLATDLLPWIRRLANPDRES